MLTVCPPADGWWQHWHMQDVTQMRTMYFNMKEATPLSFRFAHLHLILRYAWTIGKPSHSTHPLPKAKTKEQKHRQADRIIPHICKHLSRRVYCRCTEKGLVLYIKSDKDCETLLIFSNLSFHCVAHFCLSEHSRRTWTRETGRMYSVLVLSPSFTQESHWSQADLARRILSVLALFALQQVRTGLTLEKVQWALKQYGKSVWHLASGILHHEPVKYLPLEAHNSTTKGPMRTETFTGHTLTPSQSSDQRHIHAHTKYTLLHASAQQKLILIPQRAEYQISHSVNYHQVLSHERVHPWSLTISSV